MNEFERLAVLRVLRDRTDAAIQEQRAVVEKLLLPGERRAVSLGDEAVFAWVSVTKPSGGGTLTAAVRDLDALLRWCREHRPSAITETVRPSDQAALIAEIKAGTLDEVPDGIEVSTSSPSSPTLRVNVEDGAFEALLTAVRAGRIDAMLALGGEA